MRRPIDLGHTDVYGQVTSRGSVIDQLDDLGGGREIHSLQILAIRDGRPGRRIGVTEGAAHPAPAERRVARAAAEPAEREAEAEPGRVAEDLVDALEAVGSDRFDRLRGQQ